MTSTIRQDDFEEGLLITITGGKVEPDEESDTFEIPTLQAIFSQVNKEHPLKGKVIQILSINLPFIAVRALELNGDAEYIGTLDTREHSFMKLHDHYAKTLMGPALWSKIVEDRLRKDNKPIPKSSLESPANALEKILKKIKETEAHPNIDARTKEDNKFFYDK